MGISMQEMWESMGWFARGIVFVLLFMSIYVAAIAIRKLIQLRQARTATVKFSGPFSEALANENFEEAQTLVNKYPKSHLASAFRRVFETLTFHAQDATLSAAEIASVQRMIDLNTLEQLARYRRGLGVLATVGATAPFVGLLGTTMGVVRAFVGMGQGGGAAGIAQISVGIAEALITTAFGLLVALPGVWLYNYFINRIDYISMEITYATKEFIDFLLRYESRLKAGLKGGGAESSDEADEAAVAMLDGAMQRSATAARNRMS
jgi:biopolymer transport protein ExbB/biopolymer transport protein TolQ